MPDNYGFGGKSTKGPFYLESKLDKIKIVVPFFSSSTVENIKHSSWQATYIIPDYVVFGIAPIK